MPLADLSATPSDLRITWTVDADPRRVWAGLTDPDRLPEWLGRPTACELVPDGSVVVDHGDGYLCTSTVLEVEVGSRLALTWQFPDEPESALDVRLEATADGTQLLLEHTGLGELTTSYAPGWVTHLTFLEASLAGQPLPGGQFWNLYATLARTTIARTR